MPRKPDRSIHFTKAQSLGNDFLIIDGQSTTKRWTRDRVAAICHRRTGVGADGMIILARKPNHGYNARMHNADGSRFEWSGNGLRCCGAYLAGQFPRASSFQIRTAIGEIEIRVRRQANRHVRTEFERPVPDVVAPTHHSRVSYRGLRGPWRVDAGNPQWVFFVSDFKFDWESVGADCQRHARRTHGVNVGFVQVINRARIDLRIFERGVGPTPASGSGALAAVGACLARGVVDHRVRVHSPGGEQKLVLHRLRAVFQITAEAQCVYEGVWKS